jgi:hypothetical protein
MNSQSEEDRDICRVGLDSADMLEDGSPLSELDTAIHELEISRNTSIEGCANFEL